MRLLFLYIYFICYISCQNNSAESNNINNNSDSLSTSDGNSLDNSGKKLSLNLMKDFTFIKASPLKNLPLIDSTSYNNYKDGKQLTEKEIKLLKLEDVLDDNDDIAFQHVYLRYQLALSPNFLTLVISYSYGDYEVYTSLVNYDSNMNIKGYCLIAFDEISEPWFRSQSTITKNEIIVNEINHTEKTPTINSEVFMIKPNGNIIRK